MFVPQSGEHVAFGVECLVSENPKSCLSPGEATWHWPFIPSMLKLEWQGSGLRCRANRGFDITIPPGDLSPHLHAVKALCQGMSRIRKMQEPHPGESMENARGVECFPRCACRGLIKPCRHLYAFFHLDVMAFNGDQGYIDWLKPANSMQVQ